MRDKRLGKFILHQEEIDEFPENVKLVMNEVIIVRAEYMWDRDCIEYTAISDQFVPVPPQCFPPEYTVKIQDEEYLEDEEIGKYFVAKKAVFTIKI